MKARDYILKLLNEADDIPKYLKDHPFEQPKKIDAAEADPSNPEEIKSAEGKAEEEKKDENDLADKLEKLNI